MFTACVWDHYNGDHVCLGVFDSDIAAKDAVAQAHPAAQPEPRGAMRAAIHDATGSLMWEGGQRGIGARLRPARWVWSNAAVVMAREADFVGQPSE